MSTDAAMAEAPMADPSMATEEAATTESILPSAANSWNGFIALVWSLSVFLLLGVAGYACVMSHRLRNKNKTQDDFITARRQVSTVKVAWSFFAGALGAWVIAGPASYANYAGAIGLVFYALSSGLPVIMTAYAGGFIRNKVPHVQSLTDFMGWRYGYVAKTYVGLLCIFNMCIAMLAEYSTIGSLFKSYLGSEDYPIILAVGLVTVAYTAYGGLLVSILTDQIQGIMAFLLTIVAGIYLAVKFDYPLPSMSELDATAAETYISADTIRGTNDYGYSAIFVMPASLFTATIFSEAIWQRAWAADSNRNLRKGAFFGAAGIIFVVFVLGLMGWLATWAGVIPYENPTPDYNLLIFYALPGSINDLNQINNWIGVFIILLAVVMNAGAVDSLQNGITSALSSHLMKGKPLIWTRLVVIIINIPLMIIPFALAADGKPIKVLDLFLITNMLCCTSAIPVLTGLFDRLHPYYGGVSMVLSCFMSFFFTSMYGVADCWNDELVKPDMETTFVWACVPTEGGDSSSYFSAGMTYTWYRNGYRWEYFLVAICTSLGATLLCIATHWMLQRVGIEAKPVLGFHPESGKDLTKVTAGDDIVDVDGDEGDVKKVTDSDGSN